jgi:hypothetical protein
MNNNFTPYQEALELKELGFNEECFGCYELAEVRDYKKGLEIKNEIVLNTLNGYRKYDDKSQIPAPLYQQAFKFLREKLITKIVVSERGDYIEGNFTLLPLIFLNKYEIRVMAESVSYYIDNTIGRNIPFYKEPLHKFTESATSFEEAQLACLKRMIQIVRESKSNNESGTMGISGKSMYDYPSGTMGQNWNPKI